MQNQPTSIYPSAGNPCLLGSNIGNTSSLNKEHQDGVPLPRKEEIKQTPQQMHARIQQDEPKSQMATPFIAPNLVKDFLAAVKKGNMNEIIGYISKA